MSDIVPAIACPCESGLPFSECCGVENRCAINADIVTVVAKDGTFAKHNLTPQMQASLTSVSKHPDMFPVRIDFADDKAWLVKMSPRWYRESVFLDPARIKGTIVVEANINWLKQTCDSIEWQPLSFIFHTAFCGSTLMSQSLDALFQSLPLREPEALGNLLVYQRSNPEGKGVQDSADLVLKLLSRRYTANEPVVVKANDYANPLINLLSGSHYSMPLLFMYTPLDEFLAGCLKAKNRLAWIRQRYQSIVDIAVRKLGLLPEVQINDDAYGKMAAVYWSYNIALYLDVLQQAASQARSLDFNQMLERPLEVVVEAGTFFGLTPRQNVNATAEIERLFGVYSKNSKFTYSPKQRVEDIQSALKQHRNELDEAEQLARQLLGNEYAVERLPANLLEPVKN